MAPPGPARRTASRHPPSLRRLPSGRFPCFLGTMEVLRPLPAIPLARFPSLRGTMPASACFAPFGRGTRRPRAWGLVDRPPPVAFSMETAVPPRFLENPLVFVPCSPTPPRPSRLIRLHGVTVPFPRSRRREPRDLGFRGSIARPAHSLSTLRAPDRSGHAQDSVPAVANFAGWDWLPTGFH